MSETTIKLHKAPNRWPLVLIALDKLVKAIGLVVISFVLSPGWHDTIQNWIDDAQTNPHNWLITQSLHRMEVALGYEPKTLHLVRIFVIVYAGLYLIEGVGLLYEKKWAEWMVVIGTAAFLPLEVYDFIEHPRVTMVVIFVLNVLMALYLIWRLHRQAVIKRELAALTKENQNPTHKAGSV